VKWNEAKLTSASATAEAPRVALPGLFPQDMARLRESCQQSNLPRQGCWCPAWWMSLNLPILKAPHSARPNYSKQLLCPIPFA